MKKSMFYESSPIIFENAKKLRNNLTHSEIVFWGLVKQYFPNYRFKRQHPISQYIADFYCHKLKLVIEIDGSIHQTKEIKNNDALRDKFMQSLNLKIIRFTNDEVCKNSELVIEKIKLLIESMPINQNP